MILINNLLDYATPWSLPNVYLFTGNGIVRKDGGIVMGRGAARQVRDLYPSVQYILGRSIIKKPLAKILFGTIGKGQWIGWFKVKYHWADPADLWLILRSVDQLSQLARNRPEITFHMNYPGIGNGKLKVGDVKELLRPLPDNVWIYK